MNSHPATNDFAHLDSQVEPDFWDRRAPQYEKKPVPDADAYERWVARVRHHLGPGDRVLELGCGTGTTALKIADATGSILATDVSQKMIQIAQKKAAAQGTRNVSFRQGSISDPSLAEGAFDAVLAFNLIHLVPDQHAWLRRALDLLRPGGLLITKTPCLGDQLFLIRGVVAILRLFGQAPYVNFVTEQSLLNHLTELEYRLIEEGRYPQDGHGLFLVARKD